MKPISLVTVMFFLMVILQSSVVFANTGNDDVPKIAPITKGDPAPFDGTLLNIPASAKLLTGLENDGAECDLKINTALVTQGATHQRKISIMQAELNACNDRYDKIIMIKNDQISFLEKSLLNHTSNHWYESNEFWLSTGVVAGILITVASGYALGQAARNNDI